MSNPFSFIGSRPEEKQEAKKPVETERVFMTERELLCYILGLLSNSGTAVTMGNEACIFFKKDTIQRVCNMIGKMSKTVT